MNAIEQYFPVVQFITLYKLTVTLDTAKIRCCNNTNKFFSSRYKDDITNRLPLPNIA